MQTFLIILLIFLGQMVYPHGGVDHSSEKPVTVIHSEETLISINENYRKSVKKIFLSKCFDCHSTSSKTPWYGKLPFLSKVIVHDKSEGLKHLDITSDFPFQGHGSPETDLKAILNSLQNDSMPPLRYRVVHWGSKLSTEEMKLVSEWVMQSLKALSR